MGASRGVNCRCHLFGYPKYAAHRDEEFNHSVNDLIDARLKTHLDKVDKMSDDVAAIKGQLQILEPVMEQLIARKISQSITLPEKDFLASLPLLRRSIRTGTEAKIQIDPSIVASAAKRAIEVSDTHPDVWPVATELLGYRSFLAAPEAPKVSSEGKAPPSTGWNMGPMAVTNGVPVKLSLSPPPAVPAESAFRYEQLGSNQNANVTAGPATAFMDGGGSAAIAIDNYWIKNVVFRNATIVYRGGPVRLENVYFVNCRFDFTLVPDGRNLAERLLASASVTFSTQSS